MNKNSIEFTIPKRVFGKVDVNFSFLSLYLILFTFFMYLTSISTFEKQKTTQAIESVNEKFKGKNASRIEPISMLKDGFQEGGEYDQEIKGIFKNEMPDVLFETEGSGEIYEVKLPLAQLVNHTNPPYLKTNASITLEKFAFLLKEKSNYGPLEITILLGKTKKFNASKDIVFYNQKNNILILGQIVRLFEKHGIGKQMVSIGLGNHPEDELAFQLRLAPQKDLKSE